MISPAMSRRAALAVANARLSDEQRDQVLDAARQAAGDADFAGRVKNIISLEAARAVQDQAGAP